MCVGGNPFATNNSGGGIGLQTSGAYTGPSWQNPIAPQQYQSVQAGQPFSYTTPDWIQGGLYYANQPITNYPITNFGRWNMGPTGGNTNGYGMGPSPWPAPGTLFPPPPSGDNFPGIPPPGGSSPPPGGNPPPTGGGGNPPPGSGGGVPPIPPSGGVGGGGGLTYAHQLAAARPPQAGLPTTNGMGLSPHLSGGLQVGGLANRMSQIQANQGQLQAAPFTPGIYNTPGQQALLASMANLRPGGRPGPGRVR